MSPEHPDTSLGPGHWSKDFVEHLRTVHFGLIGISVALIVIVLSSPQYDPIVALRQIHQIIELKKRWSPDWVVRHGIRKESPYDPEAKPGGAPATDMSMIGKPAEWGGDPLMPDLPRPRKKEKDEIDFGVPDTGPPDLDSYGNFVIPANGTFYGRIKTRKGESLTGRFVIANNWQQESTTPNWSPRTFPETLAAFETWWNVLSSHYNAIFPRTLYPDAGRVVNEGFISLVDEATDLQGAHPFTASLTVSAGLEDKQVTLDSLDSNRMCLFFVRRFAYVSISQKTLADEFGWVPGIFGESFADLAGATRDLRSLELDDVERFVAADAAKGREVFEAFGMKFPAGQVTLWGIIVLLSVQLYLYVYLKQLTGRLRGDDPGWDVPWIGMDPSALARMLFLVTVWILPIAAVGALGARAVIHGISSLSKEPFDYREDALLAAALLVATTLGFATWRHRPSSPTLPDPK